jgi:chromosome partitioning protein
MGKIITTNIQKGGCGKTTTTHELASKLSAIGKKVLTVDIDPQQNLSRISGSILVGYCSVHELLNGECTAEDSIQKVRNYDIIPSNKKLKKADREFIEPSDIFLLKKALDPIKDNYDFILIDTPPNLGILPQMALTAADYVIVPLEASASSIQGLGQLQEMIEKVKSDKFNTDLKILGIVLTRFSERPIFNRTMREQLKVIAKDMHTEVFNTFIRESIAVDESQGYMKSLVDYAPDSNPTKDYEALTIEFLEKVGR